ncbi:MAG: hypothetical protein ACXVJN_22650 [Mucilaginibacter sp.]
MERTEPVNPERKVSLLLKIWLYPNVTAFKIAKSRRDSFFLIVCAEMLILYGGVINTFNEKSILCFFILSIFHGIPDWIFNKQINEMAFDYYTYYNKASFYIFFIFLAFGFASFCILFNDEIGHVRK